MKSVDFHCFLQNVMWKTLLIISLVCACSGQDIVFPNDEETTHLSGNKVTITERVPIYSPEKCPENMLLFPGPGNKSVWICDCRPRFVYFPKNHSCHEAYMRGPCKPGHYVVLPRGEVVPRCEVNPCREDGMVPWKNVCYNLRTKGGPCKPDVLGVNETDFQLECISTDIAPFLIIDAPKGAPCPAGSRRNALGFCKKPV